jgi:hypothetical protein
MKKAASQKEAAYITGLDKCKTQPRHYLTGQVAAAYAVGNGFKPFPTNDFWSLAYGHF